MTKFLTDFSEYTVDQQPADWTQHFYNGTFQTKGTTGEGGKSLRFYMGSGTSQPYGLYWNDVDTPAGAQEVVYRVQHSLSGSSGHAGGALLRGKDAGQLNGDGYELYYYRQNTSSGYFVVGKVTNSSFTQIGNFSTDTNYGENTWFWVRFRAEGSTLYFKHWADGAAEPASWTASWTDTTYANPGFCGTTAFVVTASIYWDVFGVGTAGQTAPKSSADMGDALVQPPAATADAVAPAPAMPVKDSFDRANSTSLGTSDTGQPWTEYFNGMGISTNQAYSEGAPGAAHLETNRADGIVKADIKHGGDNGLVVRATSSSNLLMVRLGADAVEAYRREADVWTQLGTAAMALTVGQVYAFRAELDGSAIDLYVDDVLKLSITSTFNQTATLHGMYGANGNSQTWDNFAVTAFESTATNVNVSAVPATATADALAPSVSATKNPTISAVPAEATAAAPAPSVTAVKNVTVSAVPGTATADAPAPTVSGTTEGQVNAPVAEATASAPAPSVGVFIEVTPAAATATAEAPAPAVSVVSHISVTAPTAAASAAFPVPAVDAQVPDYTFAVSVYRSGLSADVISGTLRSTEIRGGLSAVVLAGTRTSTTARGSFNEDALLDRHGFAQTGE